MGVSMNRNKTNTQKIIIKKRGMKLHICINPYGKKKLTTFYLYYYFIKGSIYHVSLGTRYSIWKSSRSLRWFNSLGTNRWWCTVYSNSKILHGCADRLVSFCHVFFFFFLLITIKLPSSLLRSPPSCSLHPPLDFFYNITVILIYVEMIGFC